MAKLWLISHNFYRNVLHDMWTPFFFFIALQP